MEHSLPPLTGDLARAARALTQISSDLIAQRAGVALEQLRSFERGVTDLDAGQLLELRAALEHYGAQFVAEDADGGYGVRRKFSARKVKRIENWENEGGPAYEDDI
ncbi:MAG: helix-turn-helix domain-containing protein [Brachybacterium tyrofermentans]